MEREIANEIYLIHCTKGDLVMREVGALVESHICRCDVVVCSFPWPVGSTYYNYESLEWTNAYDLAGSSIVKHDPTDGFVCFVC